MKTTLFLLALYAIFGLFAFKSDAQKPVGEGTKIMSKKMATSKRVGRQGDVNALITGCEREKKTIVCGIFKGE